MTRGHVAAGLTAFAFAWGLALLAFAQWWPAYSDGGTIVEVNGSGALIGVAIPAVLALVAWTGWRAACARGSRAGRRTGDVAVWAMVFFTFITGFSIGVVTVPGTAALLIAMTLIPDRAPAAATTARFGHPA